MIEPLADSTVQQAITEALVLKEDETKVISASKLSSGNGFIHL